MEKPQCCDEPNCEYIHGPGKDFDIEQPYSAWCMGVRTGVIKGKEKAVETTPSDIFVQCLLIGSHSDAKGRHCFVTNVADAYLDLRTIILGWKKSGRLIRAFRSAFNTMSDDILTEVSDELLDIFHRSRYPHTLDVVDVGTKFIEFGCSCGEVFFREYNYRHEGKYYKPTKVDKTVFDYHRRLGHTIRYRKCKMVKKSRVGDNSRWQDWGWHPWKKGKYYKM